MQVSTTMSEQTYCPNSAEEHPSVTCGPEPRVPAVDVAKQVLSRVEQRRRLERPLVQGHTEQVQ